ncbi:MAG: electron transfer flavoprotein subunit beta/FixA family protein [Bacteroidales bacterium]|nr:electron transfer flavoprotein subunit beta/FixA family protein [Bacteroidales bacterium]
MKILVCLSNVPDTTTKIKLNSDKTSVDMTGVQWVINPWDELALTRALDLKEKSGGKIEKITVITVGEKFTEPTIRKALAVGADDAVRIDMTPTDDYEVASNIAAYVKDNPYEIILSGIESSDYNGSAVGGMLAEFLKISSVSSVSFLDVEGEEPIMKREIPGGTETVKVPVPFVAIVQKGIALDPRIPAMRGIMMARKKPLTVVEPTGEAAKSNFSGFDMPKPKAKVKMIDAENAGELITLLHEEAKVI